MLNKEMPKYVNLPIEVIDVQPAPLLDELEAILGHPPSGAEIAAHYADTEGGVLRPTLGENDAAFGGMYRNNGAEVVAATAQAIHMFNDRNAKAAPDSRAAVGVDTAHASGPIPVAGSQPEVEDTDEAEIEDEVTAEAVLVDAISTLKKVRKVAKEAMKIPQLANNTPLRAVREVLKGLMAVSQLPDEAILVFLKAFKKAVAAAEDVQPAQRPSVAASTQPRASV